MAEVKKTLNNQWYRGDEKFEITAQEYTLLKVAVEQAMQGLVTVTFPEVKAFVNVETGAYIDKPSKKQLEAGTAVETVSPEKTFSAENRKISYDGKVTQELLSARELVMVIHQRNIENGVTTDVEELERLYKESVEAAKTEAA